MKKGILQKGAMFVLGSVGDEIEIYTSLEEMNAFPNANVTQNEEMWNDCCDDTEFVGFTKLDDFTDEKPQFIQLYKDEVEIIE